MNSVKNLIVIVMLLAVSYGAFQVINSPDLSQSGDAEELNLSEGTRLLPDSNVIDDEPIPSTVSTDIGFPELPPMTMDKNTNEAPPLAFDPPSEPPSFPPPSETPNSLGGFDPGTGQGQPPQTPTSGGSSLGNNGGFQPEPVTKLVDVNPLVDSEELAKRTQPPASGFEAGQSFGTLNPAPTEGQSLEPGSPIDWAQIEQMVVSGQLRNALKELSAHYKSDLGEQEQAELLGWLDPLAGKVIYSTEHHLASLPYVCQQGDTLESLSAAWKVPAELIFNVNREKLNNQFVITPGIELKKIQGPFSAEVSLGNQQMTLFLGDLYAGRFPIQIGNSSVIEPGSFAVTSKSDSGKDYTDGFGQVLAAGNINNPFGQYSIDLGNRISIHDVNDVAQPGTSFGSVRMSSRDASDVFGILSNGSGVRIIR